jgi:exodeoxyribonuclease III
MRIVAWNCNMALDRKVEVLLALKPDIAIVSESAEPERLRFRQRPEWVESEPVWIGRNPHKGLAVFAFNGYAVRIAEVYEPRFRYIAPVHISGPVDCNLLAVWAQNASAGITRKGQAGPLRRALAKYKDFISARPGILAGDLNNNVIWDKPGWRNNHKLSVATLASLGLLSAYHEFHGEPQGGESQPTLYWRDRKKDGPTYHIDYVFLPDPWIARVTDLRLGSFEEWCATGLSDHVPVIVDVGL